MTGVNRWAIGHDRCKACGTTEYKHRARGLCASCYEAAAEKRHKSHVTRDTKYLAVAITKEDLEQKYKSGLSLNEIARQYNCTRQNIHKLMRRFGITIRTLSEARSLALEQGKISYRSDIKSPGKTISHEKRHVDETFFKTWTPAMAWVLGVIYTDGCLADSVRPKGQSKSAKSGQLRLREQLELANCGEVTAQFYLAAMYKHGIQALKWYILAAEGGDKLAAVARDELSRTMLPAEITEAQEQAQDWVPQAKKADKVYWCLSIGQKEPELLEKVREQMGSNALISFSDKRGVAGELYNLRITNASVCADLQELGVTPRKSLTISFPPMPPHVVRDFIRGCWDGDGSVFWSGDPPRPSASYITGSKVFVEELVKHLVGLGLPDRTIRIGKPAKSGAHQSYSFRFDGGDCALLYHVLYDNVDEGICLSRKRDRFKSIADQYDRQVRQEPPIAPIRRRVISLSEQIARADANLGGGGADSVPMGPRAQQIKAANVALKKKLESFKGTKP